MKLFPKNETELETDRSNKNIQPGYRNGIWHRKMYRTIFNYETREKKIAQDWLYSWKNTHTHTHTNTHIYIFRDRETDKKKEWLQFPLSNNDVHEHTQHIYWVYIDFGRMTVYIYIYIYMKVTGKNIIQIGEYIMMWSRR